MQAGGWPGGAEVLPHTLASPTFSSRTHGSVAAPSSKTIGDSEPDEGISVTSFGSSSQRPRPPISSSHSGSKQIVSMQESREPGHRFQEPKASIVNRGVRNKESVSSKVRFNTDSVEAFYYNKASPSCRLHCRKHTDDTPDPQKAISGTTAIVPLAEAIHKARNNDVQGFLLCLQKPGQIQANDLTSVYEYTRRKGYETVHNILRIYKASSLAVGLAQSLKMWEAFEIRIRSITGLYVADLASSKSITTFKGAVYFYVNEAGKKHTSLPPMDLDSYVDYGSGAAALPEYGPLHYNSALKDDRRLVIHLHSPSGDMVPIAKLGIPLGEVREICTVYDNYFSTEREFKCEDAVKPGVKLHFQASRKRVNPDHLGKFCLLFSSSSKSSFF